jgi:trigger factor
LKLAVEVAEISQSKKDLSIEVDAAEVKAEFEKAYESLARNAKVPGFRPGHVPRGVVKQRFGKEVQEDVLGRLMEHALQHAIVDQRLHVVGHPQIGDVSFNEGEALKFKASLEVVPDFELKPYKGLSVKKVIARVTEKDVDGVLERWREESAEFVPIEERPSQDGDFVSLNLIGKYVEEPAAGEIKTDDLQLELGAEGNMREFNENLRGVKEGDSRSFRISYPENYASKELAGKTVDFTVAVLAVRAKEMPELDDDFAHEYGERESIQQLREEIKVDLSKNVEAQAEMRMKNDLLAQIVGAYDFEVPETLIEEQARHMAHDFAYNLTRRGYSPESIRAINWEEQLKELRAQAVTDIRTIFVLDRIARAEGIEVTEEEVDHEIVRMAHESGERFEQLKARLTKDESLSSIESRLTNLKALGMISKSAEVTVEELSEEADVEKQTEKEET